MGVTFVDRTSDFYAFFVVLSVCTYCDAARQLSIGSLFTENLNVSAFGFRRGVIVHNVFNNETNSFQFVGYEKQIRTGNSFEMGQEICDLFTKNVLLIGADVEPPLITTAASYSSTFHMPIIVTSLSKRDIGHKRIGTTNYLVSMMPSLVPVVYDILQFYKWNRFGYIFDGDAGLLRLNTLMEKFSVLRGVDIAFRQIDSDASIIRALKEFRDTDRHRVICDTNTQSTSALMKQIPLLGMLTSSYHYILMDLDINEVDLTNFQLGGMNITGLNIVNKTTDSYRILRNGWLAMIKRTQDLSLYKELKFATEMDRLNLTKSRPEYVNTSSGWFDILNKTFQSYSMLKAGWTALLESKTRSLAEQQPYLSYRSSLMKDMVEAMATTVRILKRENKLSQFALRGRRSCTDEIFRPWGFDARVLAYLKKVSFEGATGPVSFDSFGERTNYVVRILSLFSDGIREVGTWRSEAKKRLQFDRGVYGDASGPVDFNNKTIMVTSILDPPFLIRKEPRHLYTGNDRFQGYGVDLLQEVVKKFPFKYKIKLVRDKTYGVPVNGTWNGMVGELLDGKADIAVAPLTIISDRERVIDFTKPFMSLGISIMIKKPQTTKPDVFSFMHPLSYEIWMCIVLAYAGVSVVLFLVSRFSPNEWYPVEYTRVPTEESPSGVTSDYGNKTANEFNIKNSLWFSFGALMQQGCDISPRSLSGRVVGGVWWFFTLIIISSYTANLAAFLTVERMVTEIKSAEDLVQSKDVSYGMLAGGSTEEFFKESKIPLYKKMWEYMNSSKRSAFMTSNDQGLERVRHMNGKFAFLAESTLNEYFSQQKPCDTMKVGENLDSKSYGIGVSRNLTKFNDELTLAILQLREEGVLDALKKRWWYDKGQCQETPSDSGSNALSLSNVAGVFYILMGGLALALFSAILEFYWKSRSQSRKQKTSLAAAMRAKVRLSVTGESSDLASQLHQKNNTSVQSTDTETTPIEKPKVSSTEGSQTAV